MLFSSNLFLFLFLPAVLIIYYLLNRHVRNPFLLLVSLIFYAWGTGKFVIMMVASALFNYVVALILDALRESKWKKQLNVLSTAISK